MWSLLAELNFQEIMYDDGLTDDDVYICTITGERNVAVLWLSSIVHKVGRE